MAVMFAPILKKRKSANITTLGAFFNTLYYVSTKSLLNYIYMAKDFMASIRGKLQRLYPSSRIKQYSRNYSFRIYDCEHGNDAINSEIEKMGGRISKTQTITTPHTKFLFITF